MKKSLRFLTLLIVPILAFTLAACSSGQQSQSSASASSGAAEAAANNPVPDAQATEASPTVVVVSGTNEEMGYQYACQVPDLIYRNSVLLKSKVEAQYGAELAKTDMQVWSYYADKYDPGLRQWIEGMQKGLAENGYTVDYYDLLTITVYSAEMWCRPPVDQPYPEETGITLPETDAENTDSEIHSCTGFVATGDATPDGNPIVGVTKMITPEKANSIILLAYPEEGNYFFSNPMAGSVSENAGLNSAGYAWVFTAQWGPPIWGVINEVFFHNMVQNCSTPDEAIEFLNNSPRAGVTGAFLMASAKDGIKGYESHSDVAETRVPGDSGEEGNYMVQTNHLVNPKLAEHNAGGAVGGSLYRYATMLEYVKEAAENGGVTFETAKKAYYSDDWYDPEAKEWHQNEPGAEGVNDNTSSLAQAVFLPADMTAYFEVGTPNGVGLPGKATGEYVKFTLGENPLAVSNDADQTAQQYFWEARNQFVKMQNDKAKALTYEAAESIRELIDAAAIELEYGMDRAAFAYAADGNGQSPVEQMQLWGEALTHFAKSQMCSQMATSKLESLS